MASIPPLGYASTVNRVLEIPEIIELILEFLDLGDNARNALVCKRWSEICLDLLWRKVDNLPRLFSLLAPLHATRDGIYENFDRTLNLDDWRRFGRYARRVRTLTHAEGGEAMRTELYLGQAVFDELARSRTSLSIVPNLHTLHWRSDRLRPSVLFMSTTVRHFSVQLPKFTGQFLFDFFEDIAERMPFLTHLDLSFELPVRNIEGSLVNLFKKLEKLKTVVLPLFCLSSRVFEGLSILPSLGTIQFEYMEQQGRGDERDVQPFSPVLQEGAFPNLWDLSLSADLPDMIRLLNRSYAPTNLTTLYIHMLTPTQPSVISDFLVTVSEVCKQLKKLYLELFVPKNSALPAIDRLSWADLRPLLSFNQLSVFELRLDLALDISQGDIEELAAGWPSLEVLYLNNEPMPLIGGEASPLTLRALIPFAQHCPKLRELGLYLSGSIEDPNSFASTKNGLHLTLEPFRELVKLCVGVSSISEPASVALFLSQLCPLGCEILPGVSWPDGVGVVQVGHPMAQDIQRLSNEWYEKWNEVGRFLPLLTHLRMEERERRRALQEEVEDLRVRCKLLEERASLPTSELDGSCVVL